MHTGLHQVDFATDKKPILNADAEPNANNHDHSQKHREGRFVRIPVDLQHYLTTTSRPNEICSKLHDSREKRLRLLLRRFTNQIQYGCKNPYCNVPSCLSYRKRHSNVPIRPYTDVAARALAWRYVEDYANGASNTVLEPEYGNINKRKHMKRLAPCERADALCWNEPIIPWYADAADHLRKCRATQDQSSGIPYRGTSRKQSEPSPSPPGSDSQQSPKMNGSTVSFVKTNSGSVDENNVTRPMIKQSLAPTAATTLSTNLSSAHEDSIKLPRTVRFASETAILESSLEPPKDTASFSQILYDTDAIKSFDHPLQRTDHPPNQHSLLDSIDGAYNETMSDHNIEQHSRFVTQNADSQHTSYTFSILNKRVISWLVTLVSHNPDDLISIDGAKSQKLISVASLAKQSLHYCLSHPFRLLQSAEAWRVDSDPENNARADVDQPAGTTATHSNIKSQSESSFQDPFARPLLPSLGDGIMAFDVLSGIQPYTQVLDSIFAALQHAYIIPPTLQKQLMTTRGKSQHNLGLKQQAGEYLGKSGPFPGFLDDQHVASLCIVTLMALTDSSTRFLDQFEFPVDEVTLASTYINYLWCREIGRAFPHAYMSESSNPKSDPQWKKVYGAVLLRIDANDNMHLVRLVDALANVISHRLAIYETLKTVKAHPTSQRSERNIVELIIDQIMHSDKPDSPLITHSASSLLDLMSIVLQKQWNKKSVIPRTSSIAGALQMLAGLYRNRVKFNIPTHAFTFKFIAEALDASRMPLEWLNFREDTKQTHILSFAFLFDPSNLVKYFRAINIEIMRKSYEYAQINQAYARYFLLDKRVPLFGAQEVLAELRPHMARYFVLTVRRQSILEDAIDQIWRRQRQELMRPLKVSLGKNEGEDGLDHGGVQQEFFRMVFGEALNTAFGMFTIDERTQMTWFQPESLEPLYKFEALGILMSLAVYNAVTLPVTFPLAFYRKLLGFRVKHLEHIEDGWPELAKGLRTMQEWTEGDVGDVIARTYEFCYRVFDTDVTVDMSRTSRGDRWPPLDRRKSKDKSKAATFEHDQADHEMSAAISASIDDKQFSNSFSQRSTVSTSEDLTKLFLRDTTSSNSRVSRRHDTHATLTSEAPLVTNANRHQYIKDYVFWLTDKSIEAQYKAFAKGFHTCLDSTALSIFTPEALKTVVEGHVEIDIDGLQASTTYDDFISTDQIIVDFWNIVKDMSPEQHRKLLEFVTACDRVPVSGISSVTFIIQKNGEGDDRLPSSSTCYGRLLLPKYSSKEIMKTKLEKAIENSVGFGSL